MNEWSGNHDGKQACDTIDETPIPSCDEKGLQQKESGFLDSDGCGMSHSQAKGSETSIVCSQNSSSFKIEKLPLSDTSSSFLANRGHAPSLPNTDHEVKDD